MGVGQQWDNTCKACSCYGKFEARASGEKGSGRVERSLEWRQPLYLLSTIMHLYFDTTASVVPLKRGKTYRPAKLPPTAPATPKPRSQMLLCIGKKRRQWRHAGSFALNKLVGHVA